MTIIYAIIRTLGFPVCAILVLLAYYEGLPFVSRIPYIGVIPVVGDLAVGEKRRYASDQVQISTANMVAKFELSAAQAQIARERELRNAADQAATEAQKRADATLRAKQTAEAEIDRLNQEAQSYQGLSVPTEGDRKWLSEH